MTHANDNRHSRRCSKCAEVTPADGFYGGLSECKSCTKERVRKHRRLNDSVRACDRKRGNRQDAATRQAYRAAHPAACKAQTAVGNALRDGRLRREPCLFCGETRVHGHHRDYSKPLDVIWLCARCHHRLHANFPETAAHEPRHERAA